MKLAVFDIDGTLTRGVGLGTRCYFDALQETFSIPSVERDLRAYGQSTDRGILHEAVLRALGRAPERGETIAFEARYVASLERALVDAPQAYRPVDGATRVMQALVAGGGWCVAIATGNWRRAAALKLATAGIDAPSVGAHAEDGRARSEVLWAAVSRMRVALGDEPLEDVVYVGDQPWDLEAARDVGAGFVGIGAGERAGRLVAEDTRVLCDYERFPDFADALQAVSARREREGRALRLGPIRDS